MPTSILSPSSTIPTQLDPIPGNPDSVLRRLHFKQREWADLPASSKLEYIERIIDSMASAGHEAFLEMANKNLEMMGMSEDTPEGKAQAAETAFFSCLSVKNTLLGFKQAYELRAGISQHDYTLKNLFTRKSINGQVVAQIIPGNPAATLNPFAKNNTGEIWFEPDIKDAASIQPFDFGVCDEKADGICVVLGAGNWDFLAVNDVLHGLFSKNQAVLLKHHPLRGASLDPLIRSILKPVLENGYFESEMDHSPNRSSDIVYSSLVSTVMLTGGKRTHDAIVWGSEEPDVKKRKQENNPKLKAKMCAELGAVTPWIFPPADFTEEELDHQAHSLASAIFNNSSCNCNAPKVVILSKSWKMAPKFKQLVEKWWAKFETPCCYYPGSRERWLATQENMTCTKVVKSTNGLSNNDRDLRTPMFGSDGPVTLDLLAVEVDVHLSSAAGRSQAKEQYAFQNEPFAPTLTYANIADDNGNLDEFMKKAVILANDYLFGTLSCSISIPPALEGSDVVERAIADLQYGGICVNGWSAICFVSGLPWGGFPRKERDLASVQTGAAKIFNQYFLPGVEKTVIRTPTVADNHVLKSAEFADPSGTIEMLKSFVASK